MTPLRLLTDRQLQALARTVEKRIARQLVGALLKARSGIPLSALEKAIIARNFDAAAKALGLDQVVAALQAAQQATAVVRDQAWFSVLATLPPSASPRQLVALTVGRYARQSPRVMEAIRRQDLTRIRGIRQETTVAIRQTMTRSLAQGIPPAETARQLRSVLGLNRRQAGAVRAVRQRLRGLDLDQATIDRRVERYAQRQLNQRATTVARTETMTALNAGQRLQRERLVTEGVIKSEQWEQEWLTADDGERVCPVCEPLHGVRVPIGGSWTSVVGTLSGPPAHPNCVLGGTLVTASPRIAATSERIYDGKIIVIRTAGGKELTCTPNHPILTLAGWQAVETIEVGEQVVVQSLGQGEGVGERNDQHVPPSIEEIAQAARGTRGMAAAEVPVAAPDFHGDGEGSEVAVIRTHGLLGHDSKAPIGENRPNHIFIGGAVRHAFSSSLGSSQKPSEGNGATAHRCVRCSRLAIPGSGRHLGPLQALRFRLTTALSTDIVQTSFDDVAGHPKVGGDSVHGFPGVEPANDLVNRQAVSGASASLALATVDTRLDECAADGIPSNADDLRDFLERAAFAIELDRVVCIERLPWRGHVYNLETEGGWYAANGIITHNCRCLVRTVLKGFRAGAAPSAARRAILRTPV